MTDYAYEAMAMPMPGLWLWPKIGKSLDLDYLIKIEKIPLI